MVIEEIPMLRDFLDVFPNELVNLPPNKEIKVFIGVLPRKPSIVRTPYKMTPKELQELKV